MEEKDEIIEYGQCEIEGIQVVTIIGEIEGHDCLSQNAKSTKYEHLLPQLAQWEADKECRGILFLVNTVGGDVSCGLALAEMISSMSKPTVALVIGDSHSIGVPLAVAADYTFIVPTATVIIHPVRMSGTVLGAPQTYKEFHLIQDRIVGFIASHSHASKEKVEQLMMNTRMMAKDLGTLLVGEEAVEAGIVDSIGGLKDAFAKLSAYCNKEKREV